MRIGYSYLRYSSDQQGDGDSIRRQTSLAKAWCDRHNVRLDFNTTFTDRGKSAFRGKHRLTGALGVFLAEVKAGHIPRGSVLIVENLDRLSREDTYEAINLLTSLVIAGISVVTLSPSEMLYENGRNNLGGLISAVVEFGRANSVAGSMKDRSDQNWLMKKSLARESRKIMTAAVPAWIAKRDRDVPAVRTKTGKLVQPKALVLDKNGKMTLDRAKAETVRRIFKMAVAGFSAMQIVRKLIADKTPPIARSEWSAAYIFKILHGREVLGELQPRTNGKKPDGAPIPNYYPPVIDEGTWAQAQGAIAGHKKVLGLAAGGKNVASLFTGMLIDARSQSRMLITWGTSKVRLGKYRRAIAAQVPGSRSDARFFSVSSFRDGHFGPTKGKSPC